MHKTILNTIKQHNMLTPGDRVLVGLSGGADSVVLLAVLTSLCKEWEISVCAAHINHNLRSAAMDDEKFAQRICEKMGIPFLAFNADVKGLAGKEKLSIEEAGRKLRYQYLNQGLLQLNATKIAMGHHADDNTETILLNLFRGAGLKGLCGIPPVNGQVIRPLLEVSRKDIEAYASENSLCFITDETNAENDYSRNYIRNKIIPAIQGHFGVNVSATIAKNALGMRADEDFLDTAAKKAFDALHPPLSHPNPVSISLKINELLTHPPALTNRLIRHAITILRNEALRDIQSAHIQSIIDIAQGRTGRAVSLPGFTAMREYENLILQKNELPKTDYSYPIFPNIPVSTPYVTVNLTLHESPKNQSCCTHAFNYDKVHALELRTRRPGDKITLAGTGTKKLQDYFTDTKTPKSQRDQVPLLADGSNILWIMDRHNRINTAFKPISGKKTCWITVKYALIGSEQ